LDRILRRARAGSRRSTVDVRRCSSGPNPSRAVAPPSVTPSASVILPVYNARELVCDQLDALAEQVVGSTVECIVIDDASTDGTTDAIRAWIDRTGNSAKFRVVTRAARGGPNA